MPFSSFLMEWKIFFSYTNKVLTSIYENQPSLAKEKMVKCSDATPTFQPITGQIVVNLLNSQHIAAKHFEQLSQTKRTDYATDLLQAPPLKLQVTNKIISVKIAKPFFDWARIVFKPAPNVSPKSPASQFCPLSSLHIQNWMAWRK